MFKIIGADGKEYGPVSTEQLKQWIAEGRANAQTRVLAPDTAEWKTIAEVPELAAALAIAPAAAAVYATPPAPGASPLPPDVHERDYRMDIGDCINRAWQLLTGPKAWLVIGGVAIWLAIQGALSLFAQIPLLGLLFSAASLVISGPLTGGVYYFLLRNIRGETADAGDVFAGFKYCFAQLFLGYLVTALLTFAAMLPGLIALVGGILLQSNHRDGEPVAILLMVVGGVIMLIPAIYLSVGWMFTLPLIMDQRLEFWPAMQLSRKVVGKHWWTAFALGIIVGVICVIGLSLCCIGLFFTIPLGFAVAMNAYENLFSARSVATATSLAPTTPHNQT